MHRPISIHALREEGDAKQYHSAKSWNISIHALREEGDWKYMTRLYVDERISIHALREEGDPASTHHRSSGPGISIHALREEGDILAIDTVKDGEISIHALREEGDCIRALPVSREIDFYPRPPRGGRP